MIPSDVMATGDDVRENVKVLEGIQSLNRTPSSFFYFRAEFLLHSSSDCITAAHRFNF